MVTQAREIRDWLGQDEPRLRDLVGTSRPASEQEPTDEELIEIGKAEGYEALAHALIAS